jgi:predicted enzyme related to lactoylglutathione lyase
MDRATTFYRDTLGLELGYASPHWTSFKTGSTTLALHHRMDESPFGSKSNFLAILLVADLTAAQARLKDAGVWCADEFHEVPGGKICDFRDTEGNALQLIQRF